MLGARVPTGYRRYSKSIASNHQNLRQLKDSLDEADHLRGLVPQFEMIAGASNYLNLLIQGAV